MNTPYLLSDVYKRQCVTIVSTAVYAGIQLYHMYLEKNGKYSVSTKIQTEDSSGKINLPETLHDIEIQAEYIPEGMEWTCLLYTSIVGMVGDREIQIAQ